MLHTCAVENIRPYFSVRVNVVIYYYWMAAHSCCQRWAVLYSRPVPFPNPSDPFSKRADLFLQRFSDCPVPYSKRADAFLQLLSNWPGLLKRPVGPLHQAPRPLLQPPRLSTPRLQPHRILQARRHLLPPID
jgi:hypothetical protein